MGDEDYSEVAMVIGDKEFDDAIVFIGNLIFEKHKDEIHIQRCFGCSKLAASPIAEQCCWCSAEWRGQNPLRKIWDDQQLKKSAQQGDAPESRT